MAEYGALARTNLNWPRAALTLTQIVHPLSCLVLAQSACVCKGEQHEYAITEPVAVEETMASRTCRNITGSRQPPSRRQVNAALFLARWPEASGDAASLYSQTTSTHSR